jgi:hypothetical protein
MRYKSVFLDTIGYELAPNVVSSQALESRTLPVYERLRVPFGQQQPAILPNAKKRELGPVFSQSLRLQIATSNVRTEAFSDGF